MKALVYTTEGRMLTPNNKDLDCHQILEFYKIPESVKDMKSLMQTYLERMKSYCYVLGFEPSIITFSVIDDTPVGTQEYAVYTTEGACITPSKRDIDNSILLGIVEASSKKEAINKIWKSSITLYGATEPTTLKDEGFNKARLKAVPLKEGF